MPLPAALAARLAKRGIKVNESKKEGEEIFAEDKSTSILDEFGQKLPKNWDKVFYLIHFKFGYGQGDHII